MIECEKRDIVGEPKEKIELLSSEDGSSKKVVKYRVQGNYKKLP